jgi:hypothetical protein
VTRTIYRERIPSTDPRLGRHVLHDSQSRRFPVDTAGLSIVSVRHTRRIAILDQGQLGSCTGNAGVGCLGTDPYYGTLAPSRLLASTPLSVDEMADLRARLAEAASSGAPAMVLGDSVVYTRSRTLPRYSLDEPGAVQLYSDATAVDDYPGQYPPEDTGCDGLTIAKVLTAVGEISGYTWAFNLGDALKALSVTPYITGINWYADMFNPTPEGLVRPAGALAGGHEIVVDEYDSTRGWVGFTNSWGSSWGLAGRFYMAAEDYGTLLGQRGDVTVFTPATLPAPVPTPPAPVPPADPDVVFAAVLRPWVARRHIGGNAVVQRAAKTWLAARGLG